MLARATSNMPLVEPTRSRCKILKLVKFSTEDVPSQMIIEIDVGTLGSIADPFARILRFNDLSHISSNQFSEPRLTTSGMNKVLP